jgi:hypothetical protein
MVRGNDGTITCHKARYGDPDKLRGSGHPPVIAMTREATSSKARSKPLLHATQGHDDGLSDNRT